MAAWKRPDMFADCVASLRAATDDVVLYVTAMRDAGGTQEAAVGMYDVGLIDHLLLTDPIG